MGNYLSPLFGSEPEPQNVAGPQQNRRYRQVGYGVNDLSASADTVSVRPQSLPSAEHRNAFDSFKRRNKVDTDSSHVEYNLHKLEGVDINDLYRMERDFNEFSKFYPCLPITSTRAKNERRSGTQNVMDSFTHSDAIRFAVSTFEWQSISANSLSSLPRRQYTVLVTQPRPSSTIVAYYRVVCEFEKKYILEACHMDLLGFHRVDLRFVEVTDRTSVNGLEKRSAIGILLIGDVVAVHSLAKNLGTFEIADPSLDVLNRLSVQPCAWMVCKMEVLNRRQRKVQFIIKNGAVIVIKGCKNAHNFILASNLNLQEDILYTGNMSLTMRPSHPYSQGWLKEKSQNLEEEAAKFAKFPFPDGVIFRATPCDAEKQKKILKSVRRKEKRTKNEEVRQESETQNQMSKQFGKEHDSGSGLSEQEKPKSGAQLDVEREANVFSEFYTSDKNQVKLVDIGPVHKALRKYKHLDALRFAAESSVWKANLQSSLPRLPRQKDRLTSLDFPTGFSDSKINAFYRVIDEKADKYILVASHVNVHGFHRGDLRFVEVNDRTVVEGFEGKSVVGQLFLGDTVAVTKLTQTDSSTPTTPKSVFQVTHATPCTWIVANMCVLPRNEQNNLIFSVLKNGAAIVKGCNEAMNVVVDPKKQPKETSPMADHLYRGSGFFPESVESIFAWDYDRMHKIGVTSVAAKIPTYPKPLGTIYSFEYSAELTEQFNIGCSAFEQKNHSGPDGAEVVQTCAVMGYSAAQTVFNGRFDSRTFEMSNIRKNGLLIFFFIPNPRGQPTLGKWTSNNRIKIGGRFAGEVNAVIETAIAGGEFLQIVARISRAAPRNLQFNNEEQYVVSQKEPFEAILLPDIFYQMMDPTTNGARIIRTLYGGSRIERVTRASESNNIFKFGDVVLNDSQREYVQMVLDRNPMVIGSSPFGCGKSMTIVTAALELMAREKDQESGKKKEHSQQLLVTQSNYASVNLVHIMDKVKDSRTSFKFLRYVSDKNWEELPDGCRTDHDLPKLMGDEFLKWATDPIGSGGKELGNRRKFIIMKYLMATGRVDSERLSADAKEIYEQIQSSLKNEKLKKPFPGELIEPFLILFTPDIIISTVDSLQGLLSYGIVKEVSTVQVDEASQVPEYTLINLFATFPDACFSLIGDTRQLPPYCEDELTGKLKEYGIGNTMERALEGGMFPKTTLKYVYRCHPVITSLLSDIFYERDLISGVSEEQRNTFMRKRPDFWPNLHFPMIIVDNKANSQQMGTSSGNKSEVQIVKQLLQMLTKKHNGYELHARDIGVISFYSAQTSVLMEALRGSGVKCGTVDSFQGTEREVVILCCTNEKLSEFMQLANRLNVAMSRARQATIIIGNVHGLRKAKYWSTILEKVHENGCLMNMNEPVQPSFQGNYGGYRGDRGRFNNI
ncbi:unnamed protein product [Caenorhabditis sp. 36 PRJEB53466]|nr:unnamed protein product [Caenorhabditis sp. 36 PRJEB53466]